VQAAIVSNVPFYESYNAIEDAGSLNQTLLPTRWNSHYLE
jgi:hypothetical protein